MLGVNHCEVEGGRFLAIVDRDGKGGETFLQGVWNGSSRSRKEVEEELKDTLKSLSTPDRPIEPKLAAELGLAP